MFKREKLRTKDYINQSETEKALESEENESETMKTIKNEHVASARTSIGYEESGKRCLWTVTTNK